MVDGIIFVIYGVAVCVLIAMALQLRRSFHQGKPSLSANPLAFESDLPSVTVCIPARNEQHALAECLEQVVRTRYEKLEILVLDDASVDDTSILIKSFAHAGVRFAQGDPLPEGWLGRNFAMQGLLKRASGSYILFMDVDTRLGPMAIENIVRYALSKRAAMVSVIPRREDGLRFSVVASPLRFFWELLFNRKGAPAAASNAWLVNRAVLEKRLGGFESHKRAIQPESHIAAELAKTNEYRFLISTKAFGFMYEKKWQSQMETSIRLIFPLLGAQAGLAFIALLDLFLLLVPFVLALCFFIFDFAPILLPALFIHIAFSCLYSIYATRVWRRGWIIGGILWPLIVLQECILVATSSIRYKRQTVTWKGRTVQPAKSSL